MGGVNLRNTLTAIGDTEFTVNNVVSITNPFFVQRDRLNAATSTPSTMSN